jgi:hypothetical protein
MSDLGSANWSETDASNTAAVPDGWPEGMNPSGVNNAARANMGGEKRWWNRSNAVKTTAGTSTAYTLTYDVAAAAYYDGEEFSFVVDETCGASPTLNINGLGARQIRKFLGGGWGNLAASDIAATQIVRVRYNLTATTFDVVAASLFQGLVLPGFLFGLGTSNNVATSNTKIDVASGRCADSTAAQMMIYAGGTLDCGTNGANGMDTGGLPISGTLHIYLIGKTDGTTALLGSINASSPTMPTGYTLKRRLWSTNTDGSAHLWPYTQYGDKGIWKTAVTETFAATITLGGVPTGIVVEAILWAEIFGSSGGAGFAIYPIGGDSSVTQLGITASGEAAGVFTVFTSTAAQVSGTVSGSPSRSLKTVGWIDRRGRDG